MQLIGDATRIEFICRPRDDAEFAARVVALAAVLSDDATGLDLQAALRLEYPDAVVVPSGRLAPLGSTAVRYAYRDGDEGEVAPAG